VADNYRYLQLNVEEIELKNVEFRLVAKSSSICGNMQQSMPHMQHIRTAYFAKFCIFSHMFCLKEHHIF